jgi:hypothetical protein
MGVVGRTVRGVRSLSSQPVGLSRNVMQAVDGFGWTADESGNLMSMPRASDAADEVVRADFTRWGTVSVSPRI